jgi:hypothetical protein
MKKWRSLRRREHGIGICTTYEKPTYEEKVLKSSSKVVPIYLIIQSMYLISRTDARHVVVVPNRGWSFASSHLARSQGTR